MSAPERATSHPYNMLQHVHDQPEALANAVARNHAAVEQYAAQVATLDRLYIVGIGTSYHAALMGQYFARAYGGGVQAIAIDSFDFIHYGPELTEHDAVVVISHTGRKSYSLESLERAKASPALTALVTGEEGAARHDAVEHLFVTTSPEGSATYTFSYTAALGVLADLAASIGQQRTGSATLPASALSRELPDAMRAALGCEEQMKELADRYAGNRRIWLAGSGPAGVTALEVALKIKEAAYLMAEGFTTEMMLHGPFQCVDPADLMILVAPEGPGQARTLDLAKETKEIGLDLIVVSDGSSGEIEALADAVVTVPGIVEPLSAISTLVPLHHFAYWLAIACGTNPDRFRLDDERFARAYALAKL